MFAGNMGYIMFLLNRDLILYSYLYRALILYSYLYRALILHSHFIQLVPSKPNHPYPNIKAAKSFMLIVINLRIIPL